MTQTEFFDKLAALRKRHPKAEFIFLNENDRDFFDADYYYEKINHAEVFHVIEGRDFYPAMTYVWPKDKKDILSIVLECMDRDSTVSYEEYGDISTHRLMKKYLRRAFPEKSKRIIVLSYKGDNT